LSAECRRAIFLAKEHLSTLFKDVKHYDDCMEKSVTSHPDCKKLLRVEDVGAMNVINHYIALGCAEISYFSKGKDASAGIGLTPI